MVKVSYHASDTRHGLFADLRKVLEWSWLADEVGNLDVELVCQKYDAEPSDVEGFVREIGVNNPAYDPAADGERMRRKFYWGGDPLRELLGIDLPARSGPYDQVFTVHNGRVSDSPEILRRVGLPPDSLLWREIQNTPETYQPTPQSDTVRRRCQAQLQKRVVLRPAIRERIEAFHRERLADAPFVFGVHVRFAGHYDARAASDADFYERILGDVEFWASQVERKVSFRPAIFLATHLGELALRAADRFGDRLVCREIARNRENEDYWFVDETLEKQLEDAIIDCWLLSRCDALLGGVSNLAFTAMILNPELPFFFLDSLAGRRGG